MTRDADPQAESEQPLLKVVKGDPTPEEVAALITVISSLTTDEVPPKRRTPEWSAPHRLVRAHCAPGPNGWRSSSLPR